LPNAPRYPAMPRVRAKGRVPWIPVVLEALRVMPNYSYAARTAGISYRTIQDRRRRYPAFQQQCEIAMQPLRSLAGNVRQWVAKNRSGSVTPRATRSW
jgi:hypothetical protein